jgi:geranylgeranyl pyrophosphate synthase
MLRKKYRRGGVSQKNEEDIERMVTAATNILNRTPDLVGNVNALNDPTVLNEIANIANNLSNGEINNMDIENNATDDIVHDILLGPPPPSSQGANSLPTFSLLLLQNTLLNRGSSMEDAIEVEE